LGGESYLAPGADSVALSVSEISVGQEVVATATDANGNTSEFSSSITMAASLLSPAVDKDEGRNVRFVLRPYDFGLRSVRRRFRLSTLDSGLSTPNGPADGGNA
jgi:hypothetical protein